MFSKDYNNNYNNNISLNKLIYSSNKLNSKFVNYLNNIICLFNYNLQNDKVYLKNKIFFNYSHCIKSNSFYSYIYKNKNFNTTSYLYKKYKNNKYCSHKLKILFKYMLSLSYTIKKDLNYISNNKKYLFLIYNILRNNSVKILYNYKIKKLLYSAAIHIKNKKNIDKLKSKEQEKFIYTYFNYIINKIILKDIIYSMDKSYMTYSIYFGKTTINDINYYLYSFYIVNSRIPKIYKNNNCTIYACSNIEPSDKYILNIFNKNFILNKDINKSNKILIHTFYSTINKFIFGQNLITKKLTTYLHNFNKNSNVKPIGSFLLCGPSGTGKTELVKLITNYLYKSQNNLIQFDMSEYKEKHSLSRLIGSPPGYVGHEEGGNLINKINNYPESIILFDEIEKANKDIFSIFLQILDEGILTDSKGISCKFNKSLIFFTSNLGSKIFNSINKNEEFSVKYYNKVKSEINNNFKLEFINRINDILIFNPLSPVQLHPILVKYIHNNYSNKILISEFTKSLLSTVSYCPPQGSRFLTNNISRSVSNIDIIKKNKISLENNFIKYIILK
ncbi:hypothetical protein BcabD6B2_58990 (apicoplast) [Babesia caballi]|uniref:AAA+ ATPase domain-containing protein n=1 Tax=Babesia caballi TaxID=5871 RepID=A0AAV4M3L8_BABCB|nr:hypothetical protein BcabD6B2_58990 [Babesia caballi]